jgi:ABC-2 type transport system permease protein
VHAYKKSKATKRLAKILKEFYRDEALQKLGLSPENLAALDSPAPILNRFVLPEKPLSRVVLAYAMVGLMVMAVFLSFAYQFTSITGEKQLRITEQIVSAVRPQVWMDGKILGITLTGLSSMVSYTLLSLVFGGIVLQFTGAPALSVLTFVHLPSLLLFLVFSLMGILLWNTVLAGIASVITDPNNSGKSSLMMIPVLFVAASFLIVSDPDGSLAVFLSWFPLSSASAMPIRWAVGDVPWWSLLGSWLLLTGTFYILRKVAAKVFRVSILISGKEPSWKEVFRWAREA